MARGRLTALTSVEIYTSSSEILSAMGLVTSLSLQYALCASGFHNLSDEAISKIRLLLSDAVDYDRSQPVWHVVLRHADDARIASEKV